MEEEIIAKSNSRDMGPIAQNSENATMTPPDIANCESDESGETNCEMPEMPSDMQGGPMSGNDFRGETVAVAETNEWLVPMTATGIVSGSIILAAVAVCLTIFFTNKKKSV